MSAVMCFGLGGLIFLVLGMRAPAAAVFSLFYGIAHAWLVGQGMTQSLVTIVLDMFSMQAGYLLLAVLAGTDPLVSKVLPRAPIDPAAPLSKF